ncbi:MAG: hypothetical protein HY064_06455 [Bacteroidetes bacterium]|nr:hypothetical protein [Bacteroidota bacterium]
MRLIFLFILFPAIVSAQQKKNPYQDLSDFIYANLRLYNCSCYWQGATLTKETVRENHIRSVTINDDSFYCWKRIWFDTNGRISKMHKSDDIYYYYDSTLLRNGIVRLQSVVIYTKPSEMLNPEPVDSTSFEYDQFGNLQRNISYDLPGTDKSEARYYYSTLHKIQTVTIIETTSGWINSTDTSSYSLNTRTRVIAFSMNCCPYGNWNAKLCRSNDHPHADTARYFEEDFDVLDTIPDIKFIDGKNLPQYYRLLRDTFGRIIFVQCLLEQESWSFEYDKDGLPAFVIFRTGYESDDYSVKEKYVYEYY